MKFKLLSLSLILVGTVHCHLFAQYWEVGGFLGVGGYEGDLSEVLVTPSELKPAAGLLARFNPHRFFSIKAGGYYTILTGDDKNAHSPGRLERNLHFRTNLTELSVHLEINIIGYNPNLGGKRATPYILAGASVFHFNPKAKLHGKWYELQPLGTEGQGTPQYPDREKYKLTQIAIPMGGGLKIALNKHWNLDLEFIHHKTFTDYIDDVSTTYVEPEVLIANYGWESAALANRTWEIYGTPKPYGPGKERGNSNRMDAYIFAGCNITYNFLESRGRGSGCPVNF